MSQARKERRVEIRRLSSGVPGLDDILGGGIPEYSFNLIAGAPGTGKTTLAQQIMFGNATPERPGLFFTILGEPAIKMLRYQQQFGFFDPSRIGVDIHFINLSREVMEKDLGVVLERITTEVERLNPGIVVVDSFRTVVQTTDRDKVTEVDLQHFVQRLALQLTSWETTSFLIGEFSEGESRNPVFTVGDGIVWLLNETERNATVRKVRVTKVRGQAPLSGVHTMRITDTGVEIYPRLPRPEVRRERTPDAPRRLQTGIAALDEMLGGGFPAGDAVLVTGPTGSGKTMLGTQFVASGVENGEHAVIAVFEEHPEGYIERATGMGFALDDMIARGMLDMMYLRPLDLSVDETLQELRERVQRLDAKRVVIDSLSGFEAALAPSFRQDFRESFYRLLVALTSLRVTVMSTVEVVESSDYLRFTPYNVSFLTDDILAMRYVELEGELRKVISVIKMRGSNHSRELRAYDVTSHGIELGESLKDYRGIITGIPERRIAASESAGVVLTTAETIVLDALLRIGEASIDEIVSDTGLSAEQVQEALGRLHDVRFIRAIERDERVLYRAASLSLRQT